MNVPCTFNFVRKHSFKLFGILCVDESVLLLSPHPAGSHLPAFVVFADSEKVYNE